MIRDSISLNQLWGGERVIKANVSLHSSVHSINFPSNVIRNYYCASERALHL